MSTSWFRGMVKKDESPKRKNSCPPIWVRVQLFMWAFHTVLVEDKDAKHS